MVTRALAYGAQVSSEPLDVDLTSSPIGAVADVRLGGENTNPKVDNNLYSHVKVEDYPELRARLLETLTRYRDTIG